MVVKSSRQRNQQLHVPVLPDEKEIIQSRAKDCSLSMSSYLRNLGLGYVPKSILDSKLVLELVKINADLGRLGGLLKMWLTNDERLDGSAHNIEGVLKDIRLTQGRMLEAVKRL